MSERTYAQGLQDDEDHHLALCGLSFDARVEQELEDQASRYYDRDSFVSQVCEEPVEVRRKRRPQGNAGERFVTSSCARRHLEIDAPPRTPTLIFASGRRDPAPHDAKRAQDMWEGSGPPLRATQGSHHVLSPPPLSKT